MSAEPCSARRRAMRAIAAAGCAALLARSRPAAAIEPELRARIGSLDPARIDAAGVATLARLAAPRIVLLQGSVPIVTMAPFAAFLTGMGYPLSSLRDPYDGSVSTSSFTDSAELAGALAWHYEAEGMRPLVIGHSQGGMLAVRLLHELGGAFRSAIAVFDPQRRVALDRTSIRDPLSGESREVVGLVLPYACALATGKLFRVLLGQWEMLSKLYRIPDTVEDFTGFRLDADPISAGSEPFVAIGRAHVRNVTLPASYLHLMLPRAEHLAREPAAREWIEAYVPGTPSATLPADPPFDATNLLHAADIWYSVKMHWCREAQRLLAARP